LLLPKAWEKPKGAPLKKKVVGLVVLTGDVFVLVLVVIAGVAVVVVLQINHFFG
jgi:hypothetical protein